MTALASQSLKVTDVNGELWKVCSSSMRASLEASSATDSGMQPRWSRVGNCSTRPLSKGIVKSARVRQGLNRLAALDDDEPGLSMSTSQRSPKDRNSRHRHVSNMLQQINRSPLESRRRVRPLLDALDLNEGNSKHMSSCATAVCHSALASASPAVTHPVIAGIAEADRESLSSGLDEDFELCRKRLLDMSLPALPLTRSGVSDLLDESDLLGEKGQPSQVFVSPNSSSNSLASTCDLSPRGSDEFLASQIHLSRGFASSAHSTC